MDKSRVEVIEGIELIPIKFSLDDRGNFVKFHPMNLFSNTLDSIALSQNPILGTVRGLHFQTEPFAEEKLVTCIQGSIFDVAVDLRPYSKTFGKWTSYILNSENHLQAYQHRIPGTALFLCREPFKIPSSLVMQLHHNKYLHEKVILVSLLQNTLR